MSAKNSIKDYIPNAYYHLYNRGVEKREIFLDEQDYLVFLSYLKEYLSEKNINELRSKITDNKTSYKEKDRLVKLIRMNNFFEEVALLVFCLMPNHFHLLIKQKSANSIDVFMNSICVRYSMYFNKKYKRVGSLFQGVYKAVLVDREEYLLHLSRYIHYQAIPNRPSSLMFYLGQQNLDWINKTEILSYFSKENPGLDYKLFVLESDKNSLATISKLLLD